MYIHAHEKNSADYICDHSMLHFNIYVSRLYVFDMAVIDDISFPPFTVWKSSGAY
jgi:hypothetical protein